MIKHFFREFYGSLMRYIVQVNNVKHSAQWSIISIFSETILKEMFRKS